MKKSKKKETFPYPYLWGGLILAVALLGLILFVYQQKQLRSLREESAVMEEDLSSLRSENSSLRAAVRELSEAPEGDTVPYELLFENIVCIGDSLTEGTNSRGSHGTYPYFLHEMTGLPVTNLGYGGYSASDTWDKFASTYDFSPFDLFIVWLGTNEGFTDTLEEDVLPYQDYEDFAETQTGYYCKLLSRIIAQRPDATVILGSVYASKGDVPTSNLVIQKIADLYKDHVIGIVDNNDGSIYNPYNEEVSRLYHPTNTVHFERNGNFLLARHWLEGIREVLRNHLDRFQ